MPSILYSLCFVTSGPLAITSCEEKTFAKEKVFRFPRFPELNRVFRLNNPLALVIETYPETFSSPKNILTALASFLGLWNSPGEVSSSHCSKAVCKRKGDMRYQLADKLSHDLGLTVLLIVSGQTVGSPLTTWCNCPPDSGILVFWLLG